MERRNAPVITGTPEKLKFKKLKARLGLPFWQTVGLLESLWLITYANAPDGDIGRLSNEEIAVALEWNSDPQVLIDALVDTRWLESHPCVCHRLLVHAWPEHCSNSHKGNYAKYGKKFAINRPCDALRTVLGGSQDAPSNPTNPNQTQPTNQPTGSAAGGVDGRVDGDFLMNGWKEVADNLTRLGAARWKQGIAILRDHGCDATHALALIRYAEKQGYGAPAIIHRFKIAHPTLAIESSWPPKKESKALLLEVKERAAQEAREAADAAQIIRAGRKAKLDDKAITAQLSAAGLEWPQ